MQILYFTPRFTSYTFAFMAFVWMLSMAVTYHYVPFYIIQALQTAVIPLIIVSKVGCFVVFSPLLSGHSNRNQLPKQIYRPAGVHIRLFTIRWMCCPNLHFDPGDWRSTCNSVFCRRCCFERDYLPPNALVLEFGREEDIQRKKAQLDDINAHFLDD